MPDGFVRICSFDELSDGEIAEFMLETTPIALARVDGTYHALSNVCPHAGGPLGDGELEGSTVSCPWHGWSFDVRSGVCALDAEVEVPVFEVKTDGTDVWIALPKD